MKKYSHSGIASAALPAIMFTIAVSCSQDDKKTDYESFSLMPAPASIEGAAGEFLLRPGTGIAIDPDFTSAGNVADLFNGFLENHYRKIS